MDNSYNVIYSVSDFDEAFAAVAMFEDSSQAVDYDQLENEICELAQLIENDLN